MQDALCSRQAIRSQATNIQVMDATVIYLVTYWSEDDLMWVETHRYTN